MKLFCVQIQTSAVAIVTYILWDRILLQCMRVYLAESWVICTVSHAHQTLASIRALWISLACAVTQFFHQSGSSVASPTPRQILVKQTTVPRKPSIASRLSSAASSPRAVSICPVPSVNRFSASTHTLLIKTAHSFIAMRRFFFCAIFCSLSSKQLQRRRPTSSISTAAFCMLLLRLGRAVCGVVTKKGRLLGTPSRVQVILFCSSKACARCSNAPLQISLRRMAVHPSLLSLSQGGRG